MRLCWHFLDGRGSTSPNKAYMAYFVRQNFGYAETPYMIEALSAHCGHGKEAKNV